MIVPTRTVCCCYSRLEERKSTRICVHPTTALILEGFVVGIGVTRTRINSSHGAMFNSAGGVDLNEPACTGLCYFCVSMLGESIGTHS